jgi:hypothetical protein
MGPYMLVTIFSHALGWITGAPNIGEGLNFRSLTVGALKNTSCPTRRSRYGYSNFVIHSAFVSISRFGQVARVLLDLEDRLGDLLHVRTLADEHGLE